jgi:hypothetical protein
MPAWQLPDGSEPVDMCQGVMTAAERLRRSARQTKARSAARSGHLFLDPGPGKQVRGLPLDLRRERRRVACAVGRKVRASRPARRRCRAMRNGWPAPVQQVRILRGESGDGDVEILERAAVVTERCQTRVRAGPSGGRTMTGE